MPNNPESRSWDPSKESASKSTPDPESRPWSSENENVVVNPSVPEGLGGAKISAAEGGVEEQTGVSEAEQEEPQAEKAKKSRRKTETKAEHEETTKEIAQQIFEKRMSGDISHSGVDALLGAEGITPWSPAAEKFMREWDWQQAEKIVNGEYDEVHPLAKSAADLIYKGAEVLGKGDKKKKAATEKGMSETAAPQINPEDARLPGDVAPTPEAARTPAAESPKAAENPEDKVKAAEKSKEAKELMAELEKEFKGAEERYGDKFAKVKEWSKNLESLKQQLESVGEEADGLKTAQAILETAQSLLVQYRGEGAYVRLQEQFKNEKGVKFLDMENIKGADAQWQALLRELRENKTISDETLAKPEIKQLMEEMGFGNKEEFALFMKEAVAASHDFTVVDLKNQAKEKEEREKAGSSKFWDKKFGRLIKGFSQRFAVNTGTGMAVSYGLAAAKVGAVAGAGLFSLPGLAAVGITTGAIAAVNWGARWARNKSEYRKYGQEVNVALSDAKDETKTIRELHTNNLREVIRARQLERLRDQAKAKGEIKPTLEDIRDKYIKGKVKNRDDLRKELEKVRSDLQAELKTDEAKDKDPQKEAELKEIEAALQTLIMTDASLDVEREAETAGKRQKGMTKKEMGYEAVQVLGAGLAARVAYRLPVLAPVLSAVGGAKIGSTLSEAGIEWLAASETKPLKWIGGKLAKEKELTGAGKFVKGASKVIGAGIMGYLAFKGSNTADFMEKALKGDWAGAGAQFFGAGHTALAGEQEKQASDETVGPPKKFSEHEGQETGGTGGTSQGLSPNEKTMGGGNLEPTPEAVKPTHFEDTIDSAGMGSAHDSIWRSTREIFLKHPQELGYDPSKGVPMEQWAETQTANAVAELTKGQGGDLADLVHGPDITGHGDKVSIDIIDGKPHLKFEPTSGIAAGHLPEAAPTAEPVKAQVSEAKPQFPTERLGMDYNPDQPYRPDASPTPTAFPSERESLAHLIQAKLDKNEYAQDETRLENFIKQYQDPSLREYHENAKKYILDYINKNPESADKIQELHDFVEPKPAPVDISHQETGAPAKEPAKVELAATGGRAPAASGPEQIQHTEPAGHGGEGKDIKIGDEHKEAPPTGQPSEVRHEAGPEAVKPQAETWLSKELQIKNEQAAEMSKVMSATAGPWEANTELLKSYMAASGETDASTAQRELILARDTDVFKLASLSPTELANYEKVRLIIERKLEVQSQHNIGQAGEQLALVKKLGEYTHDLMKEKGATAPVLPAETVASTVETPPSEQAKDTAAAAALVREQIADEPNKEALVAHGKTLADELNRGFLRSARPEHLAEHTAALAGDLGLEKGQEKLFVNWLSGKDGVLKKDDLEGLLAGKGKLNLEAFVAKVDAFEQLANSKELPGENWEPRILHGEDDTIGNVRLNSGGEYEVDSDGDGRPDVRYGSDLLQRLLTGEKEQAQAIK